ncbi:MAG: zonular occludens toxin domain-containing protein [Burkholderiaceae bacterium]|nr:zonular occludens toxin domain-containing protein [Burkholderiaceae bacterium]
MITIITGTPGAGKTLYSISKLVKGVLGTTVKRTKDDGTTEEIPRRIVTNINGLLLDHELIDDGPEHGLNGWFKWCKPGDFIVFDEVQKPWPPRAAGSKVPDYISELETHRHKGVDFVLITQNPMLIDRNVTALAGRHVHVRRFGSIGAAIVYEWDHCSRSLLYSKALAKSTWKYDKSVFKLYKSSELHTKPQTRVPPLVFVVVLALAAGAYLIPSTMSRIAEKSDPGQPGDLSQSPAGPGSPARPGQPGQPAANVHALARVPGPSDNEATNGPMLDDLILTGVLSAAQNLAIFQWVPNGLPRYTFTPSQLQRWGMVVRVYADCRAELTDEHGRKRHFGCMPGVPVDTLPPALTGPAGDDSQTERSRPFNGSV